MVAALAIWSLLASLVTASLYYLDKRAAIAARRRIPERTLLGCAIVGGWPGGWIAGRWLRHKTSKTSYRISFACCVFINLVAIALVLWNLW